MSDNQSTEGLDFGDAEEPVRIRRWEESDIPTLVEVQRECYPGMAEETYMDERKLRMQQAAFPEGQFLAEIDGRIVGNGGSLKSLDAHRIGLGEAYTRFFEGRAS